jgi:hypothetical protein
MATQTSSLAGSMVVAEASFDANSDARLLNETELALANTYLDPPLPYVLGILSSHETGASDFSVTFEVTAPIDYTLGATVDVSATERIGDLPGFDITTAVASVELIGPSGSLASLSLDQADHCLSAEACAPASDTLDASGTLAPGLYTLTASVAGSAAGGCTEVPGYTPFHCFSPSANGGFDLSLSLGAATLPALSPHGLVALAAMLCGLQLVVSRAAR